MYQEVVFIHILSAFILFAFWFYEWINNILYLPKITFALRFHRLQMVTMIVVAATGIYLMRYAWGPQPWLISAIILLILAIVLTITFIFVDKLLLTNNKILNILYQSFKESLKIGIITSIIFLMSYKTQSWFLIICQTIVALIASFLLTMKIKSRFKNA